MATKLNFSMNLPEEVKARGIALSRQLAEQYDAHFVLGEDTNYPHITVYAVEFSDGAVQQVLNAAKHIAANVQRIPCTVKRVETHQGYIGVEVIKSPSIMCIHERVVEVLAPLREQEHGGGADYGMTFTAEQIANMERYGYADAMQLYNPHFTIIRLKEVGQTGKAAQSVQWDIPEFTVRSVGVYKMGDHGTCKELLGECVIH